MRHLLGPHLGPRGKVLDSLRRLQTPGVEGRVNEGQVGERRRGMKTGCALLSAGLPGQMKSIRASPII